MSEIESTEVSWSPLMKAAMPLVRREVLGAGDRARLILERARRDALMLLSEAESRAEERGREARREALETAMEDAAEIVARAEAFAREYQRTLQDQMIDAVLSVAERVWGDLGADRSEASARVARELRAEIPRCKVPRFRVHPDDVSALRGASLEPIADPSLRPGDCVAEVEGAVHDGRAVVRASLAVNALAAALGRSAKGVIDEP